MPRLIYDKEQIKRAKILLFDSLKDIVRSLGSGNAILKIHRYGQYEGYVLADDENHILQNISKSSFKTLLDANVIVEEGSTEDYQKWVIRRMDDNNKRLNPGTGRIV